MFDSLTKAIEHALIIADWFDRRDVIVFKKGKEKSEIVFDASKNFPAGRSRTYK